MPVSSSLSLPGTWSIAFPESRELVERVLRVTPGNGPLPLCARADPFSPQSASTCPTRDRCLNVHLCRFLSTSRPSRPSRRHTGHLPPPFPSDTNSGRRWHTPNARRWRAAPAAPTDVERWSTLHARQRCELRHRQHRAASSAGASCTPRGSDSRCILYARQRHALAHLLHPAQ